MRSRPATTRVSRKKTPSRLKPLGANGASDSAEPLISARFQGSHQSQIPREPQGFYQPPRFASLPRSKRFGMTADSLKYLLRPQHRMSQVEPRLQKLRHR